MNACDLAGRVPSKARCPARVPSASRAGGLEAPSDPGVTQAFFVWGAWQCCCKGHLKKEAIIFTAQERLEREIIPSAFTNGEVVGGRKEKLEAWESSSFPHALGHAGERTDTFSEVGPLLEGTDGNTVPFADCLLACRSGLGYVGSVEYRE